MDQADVQIQLVGAFGYFFLANSYFNKNKNMILNMQIVANVFLAIHYFCLSGIVGAVCDVVSIVANTIIYFFNKNNCKNKQLLAELLILFLIISCFITLFILKKPITIHEVFPVIATIMVILSFVTNSKNVIRGIGLIVAVCWLIYGFIFGSYSAIIFEILIILSTIISHFREKRQNH